MDKFRDKRILYSVAFLLVAILAYYSVLDTTLSAIPGVRTMTQECNEYLDDWTRKSITTFAVTKSINAALSVVEDSEVQLVAVNVALGEIVRPLNDMVANVSSVALASAVSLGIQQMLIDIGATVGLKWFLTASMLCWLVVVWVDSTFMRRLASGLLLLALVSRVLIPVAVLAAGYVGDQFMESAYADAQSELATLKTEAEKVDLLHAADDAPSEKGIFGTMKRAANAVVGAPERISTMISRLKDQADVYNEVAVNYIVVFIVQTMLMPILIFWGLVKLTGYVLSPAATPGMEARMSALLRGSTKSKNGSRQIPEAVTEAQG